MRPGLRSARTWAYVPALALFLFARADAVASPEGNTAREAGEAAKAEPELAKKDRERRGKTVMSAVEKQRWHAELRRRLGRPPAKVINIRNLWTHETVAVDAAAPAPGKAEILPMPQEAIDRFLRCHFTNMPTQVDGRVFAALVTAARHFKVPRIEIVSGFRSPKYNLILRKKGREVARQSEHTFGNAVDFRLPGVAVERLHAWAKQLGLGGVGFYADSGFIHIDTGKIRYWKGR